MNVTKAIITAAPRLERAAEQAIERTTRPDSDRTETEATAEGENKRSVSRAEFSALLALISGAGSRVRSDLIQQLPAEGASLVDKLLEEAAAEQTPDESTGETLTGEGAFPGEKGLRNALQHGSHDRDAERAAQEVSEALRYGILNTSIGGTPVESTAEDIIDLPTYAKNRGTNGLLGISRAAQQISAQLGGKDEMQGDRNALAVLSRIATKRGSSLEQLMAIGDVRGADARAALDALLSKAGTPAGTEIADSAAAAAATAAAATAAASASAAALAAATAASAADPTTPIKDLDAVAPELHSRVQRVIDRMKGEYGHDVSIVETARSQERQDHLYEQGRTRPGAVVTWTRDSAHTRGDAVDVIVDGSWENAQGFARLQRIAREEGLRTLGMKDPGHLELANHGERALAKAAPQALDNVTAAFQRQSSSVASAAAQAAPAGVAQVASVAGVAQVARVADANAAPVALGEGAAAYIAQANADKNGNGESNGNAFGRGARDENGHPINDGRKLGHAKQDAGETSSFGAMQGNAPSNTQKTGTERAASVGQAAGSAQAQRVSEIQAMRADAPAGPLSRMTLNVENANGTQDRITVDLRGNVVDTFISTDASSAEHMKLRTGELQESLGRHGLDAEHVRISGTAKSEQNDSSRTIGSERDALRMNGATQTTSGEGAQSQSQRDRATGRDWDKQQDARREQKEQTARDQQREQANPRGWQNLFNGTKE